jgi:Concanavalin A-like lectin/glucanases superfamily
VNIHLFTMKTIKHIPIARTRLVRILSLAFIVMSGSAQADLSSELIGRYPFDGDLLDTSGRGHNADGLGMGYATDRFGNPTGALDLRGNSNWVKIPHHSDFLIGTNDFTFSVWLKYGSQASNTTGYSAILVKSDLSYPWQGPSVFIDYNGPGTMSYRVTGTHEVKCSATNLSDNTWRQIIFVREGGRISMYVNGVLDSSDLSAPMLNLATEEPIWIGANHDNQEQQNYDGLMDDLRIYRRAISPAEVATLYEGALIVQQPQSQLGYWGKSVSLSVQIDNGAAANTYAPPFTYQWLKDGIEISGATNAQLEFLDLQIADAGDYTVVIKDAGDNTVTSQAAQLTVSPAQTSIATYAGIRRSDVHRPRLEHLDQRGERHPHPASPDLV